MIAQTKTRLVSGISVGLASIGFVLTYLGDNRLDSMWFAGFALAACVVVAASIEVRWWNRRRIEAGNRRRTVARDLLRMELEACGTCARCGQPNAYAGAVYCGAACSARAEAGA